MANKSKEEYIRIYKNRISSTLSKKNELSKIIQEINNLVYAETQKPISNADKIDILKALQQQALIECQHHYAQSDKEYLELISATIAQLGGK